MIEGSARIEIAAPPETVYAVTCALDWIGSEVAITRLAPDENGLAGPYRIATQALGKRQEAVVNVETSAPDRVGFSSVDCRECTFGGEYVLERTTAGTRVLLRMQAKPHGKLRFLGPVVGTLMQRAMDEMLGRLKARTEQRLAEAA
jgi:polyketide cyclase/dehydrase/lipid transport protein